MKKPRKRAEEYRSKRNGNTDRKIGKCKCGHSGDAAHSDHHDLEVKGNPKLHVEGTIVPGHGPCKICGPEKCKGFSWAGWTS